MSKDEVQKDLLAETKSPEKALDYAVRREKGLENQIQIRKQRASGIQNEITNVKMEPVSFVQKKGNYKPCRVDVVDEEWHKETAPTGLHKKQDFYPGLGINPSGWSIN